MKKFFSRRNKSFATTTIVDDLPSIPTSTVTVEPQHPSNSIQQEQSPPPPPPKKTSSPSSHIEVRPSNLSSTSTTTTSPNPPPTSNLTNSSPPPPPPLPPSRDPAPPRTVAFASSPLITPLPPLPSRSQTLSPTPSSPPSPPFQPLLQPIPGGDLGTIYAPITWTEMMIGSNGEGGLDLVENLGGRERTRQEVLWELVGSEERYVSELLSLHTHYIVPLLHPLRQPTTTTISPHPSHNQTFTSSASTFYQSLSSTSPASSNVHFPSVGQWGSTVGSSHGHGSTTGGGRFLASPVPTFGTSNYHQNHPGSPEPGWGRSASRAGTVGGGESMDHLPIAAKFLKRGGSLSMKSMANGVGGGSRRGSEDEGASSDTHGIGGKVGLGLGLGSQSTVELGRTNGHGVGGKASIDPSTLNGTTLNGHGGGASSINGRTTPTANGNHQLKQKPSALTTFRHHLRPPPSSKKLHKPKSAVPVEVTNPPPLPESLRIVLEVLGGGGWSGEDWSLVSSNGSTSPPSPPSNSSPSSPSGLLSLHSSLCLRLKDRYSEQWPLVRSLADVWMDQAWMIKEYATYVLHLERALGEVEEALAAASRTKGGGGGGGGLLGVGSGGGEGEEEGEVRRLGKLIMRLEEKASLDGESGLAICLSKPFQRLLKYPLLFQNLLYHTDPSTHEYESTRSMAIEIDALVRSIEDEKIDEEEREKVRDVLARIEGINNKALMAPRSSRYLIEEISIWQPASKDPKRTMSDAPRPSLNGKSSLDADRVPRFQKSSRRLSDLIIIGEGKPPSMGSKKDLWLIVFSDVVIRCQRIGVTILSRSALSKSKNSKKSKKTSVKSQQRNLYKFIQIERWEIRDPFEGKKNGSGMVSLEDINRSRGPGISKLRLRDDMGDLTETSEDDYDRESLGSRMSFSYGDDELRPNIDGPILLPKRSVTPPPTSGNGAPVKKSSSPRSASHGTSGALQKSTPAREKFGNRLRPGSNDGAMLPSIAASLKAPSEVRSKSRTGTTNGSATGGGGGGFLAPTASSLAKKEAPSPVAVAASNKVIAASRDRAISPTFSHPNARRLKLSNPPPASREKERRDGSTADGGSVSASTTVGRERKAKDDLSVKMRR